MNEDQANGSEVDETQTTTGGVEKDITSGSNLRPLSFGEKAVGLNFNPGNDQDVQEVKGLFAKIIDKLNDMRGDNRNEQARRMSIAITQAEIAQMCAVKAITWKD